MTCKYNFKCQINHSQFIFIYFLIFNKTLKVRYINHQNHQSFIKNHRPTISITPQICLFKNFITFNSSTDFEIFMLWHFLYPCVNVDELMCDWCSLNCYCRKICKYIAHYEMIIVNVECTICTQRLIEIPNQLWSIICSVNRCI